MMSSAMLSIYLSLRYFCNTDRPSYFTEEIRAGTRMRKRLRLACSANPLSDGISCHTTGPLSLDSHILHLTLIND
jgi:hypothetical protein